jgi:hypothetical protein
MKKEAAPMQDCRSWRTKAALIGCQVLTFMLCGMAAMNASFAGEASTRASKQSDTMLNHGNTRDFQQGSSGDAARGANSSAGNTGAGAGADGGAKWSADAKGDKSAGTKSDNGGAIIVGPQAGSNAMMSAGIKGGSNTRANDNANATSTGSNIERGAVTKGSSDGGVHTGINSNRTGATSSAKGAGIRGTSDGGVQTGAQHNGTTDNPIDTRITVQSPANSKDATKAMDWKKAKLGGTSNDFRRRSSAPDMKNGVARNAIGVVTTPRKATKGQDAIDPTVLQGTASSAAGAAAKNLVSVGRTATVRQTSSASPNLGLKVNDPTVKSAMNHSLLDGTDFGHPGSSTGIIGGAPKNTTGMIDGTSFRSKHP